MATVIVTDAAIRELVREALGNTNFVSSTVEEEDPVNVNDVVDPSATITDPTNTDQKPQNRAELQVALKAITDDLPDDQVPAAYDKVVHAIEIPDKNETDKQEKKMDKFKDSDDVGLGSSPEDKKKVESFVRAEIKKVLNEIRPRVTVKGSAGPVDPADLDADEEEAELSKPRKFSTMTDVSGASFEEIAKELGFSVAGAKQAVDKALLKAQYVAQADEDDLEILTLQSMNDYIKMLSKSGEMTSADIKLMKDHPEIVRELDGFREFLDRAIRRARKSEKMGESSSRPKVSEAKDPFRGKSSAELRKPHAGDPVKTIELDVSWDSADDVEHYAAKFGLRTKLVDPEGPGGGNPIYSFTGTEDQLRSYLKVYTADDQESIDYLMKNESYNPGDEISMSSQKKPDAQKPGKNVTKAKSASGRDVEVDWGRFNEMDEADGEKQHKCLRCGEEVSKTDKGWREHVHDDCIGKRMMKKMGRAPTPVSPSLGIRAKYQRMNGLGKRRPQVEVRIHGRKMIPIDVQKLFVNPGCGRGTVTAQRTMYKKEGTFRSL